MNNTMEYVYTWSCIYDDKKTVVKEYDNDDKKHSFGEVDKEKVKYFVLTPLKNGLKPYVVEINTQKEEIVFFYRKLFNVYSNEKICVYVIGIKDKDSDKITYNYILENGVTFLTTNVNFTPVDSNRDFYLKQL